MQLITVLSAALALSSGAYAWTKDANGVWVANNTWHTIRGVRVHESCTRMGDSNTILTSGMCAYWIDGAGTKLRGQCRSSGGTVSCA